MKLIWSLPGPSHLLTQVAEAILAGRHVALDWPVYAPPAAEFQRALYDRLATFDIHLQRLTPGDVPNPQRWLADRYELDAKHSLTIANLIEFSEWRGTVNWLDLSDHFQTWLRLLKDLAGHTNNQKLFERPLLVAAVPSHVNLPAPDVGIAVFQWDDYYDDMDALMLAHTSLRTRFDGVTRALLATTSSQVALYDVPLLVRLVAEEKDTILDPQTFLREEACRRGWDARTQRSRALGSAAMFAKNERLHSCIKVLDGGIERRLWRSQVNVLLPFLEEQRQIYIRRYERYLKIPFETDFHTVNDPVDLELSHLSFQAENYFRNQAWRDIPRLRQLKKARHSLAHLQPVALQDTLDLLS